MKIHFVCSGNLYRSVIAEAYLKSKQIPDLEVTSSGTKARDHLDDYAIGLTESVLAEKGIIKFRKEGWTRSTKEIIEAQDMVIFMRQMHYDFCADELACNIPKYEIWEILDRSESLSAEDLEKDNIEKEFTRQKFTEIAGHVDELLEKIEPETATV